MAARITKLLCALLPVFLLCSESKSIAQNMPSARVISLNASAQRLDAVLQNIASQAGFSFSYDADCVPFDSIISINVQNQSVGNVLKKLLPSRNIFSDKGNYIIVQCAKKQKRASNRKKITAYSVSGYVIDRISGKRIPYASVYDKSNHALALTNDYGYYSLLLPGESEKIRLSISKKNYLDTVIIVRPADGGNEMNVEMMPLISHVVPIKAATIPEQRQIEDVGLVKAIVPEKQLEQSKNIAVTEQRTFNISLLPTLSTNRLFSGIVENKISFNVLIGYNNGVNGFEMGGLANIDKKDVKGLQLAGLANLVGGRTEGIQLAGLANFTLGRVYGIQLAGITNLLMDTLTGISVCGLAGFSKSVITGVQVSGFGNVAVNNLDGMQLGGYLNVTLQTVNKLQVAGFSNYAGAVKGLQIAGFANIARNSMRGAQLAGFFNYARRVDGAQLGIINISDTLNGFALGLLSFSHSGFHKLDITGGETFYAQATFRTGMPLFHNVISAGYRPSSGNMFAAGYGLGSEIKFGKRASMDVSLIAYKIFDNGLKATHDALFSYEMTLGIRLTKKLAIIAGPALYCNYQQKLSGQESYNKSLSPYSIYMTENSASYFNFWAGGNLGIRLF
ncbi:MAG: hypothetical protein WCM76_10195 [Bacteroidota bacterium]